MTLTNHTNTWTSAISGFCCLIACYLALHSTALAQPPVQSMSEMAFSVEVHRLTVKHVGLTTSHDIRIKGDHEDTVRIDSVQLYVDDRGRVEAPELSSTMPRFLRPGLGTYIDIQFTPLVLDTMSLYVSIFSEFGVETHIIKAGEPDWTIVNQPDYSNGQIEFLAEGLANTDLIIRNTGEIDTEILSIEVETPKSSFTVQEGWTAEGRTVRVGQDLIIPLNNTLQSGEKDSLSVTVNTTTGTFRKTVPVSAIQPKHNPPSNWIIDTPLIENTIKYSSSGQRVLVRSGDVTFVIDAASGKILDSKKNHRIVELQFNGYRNQYNGSVGFNADATLAAVGGVYVDDGMLQTQLEIHEVGTDIIIDSIPLFEADERIVQTQFVEGDSILALNMFYSVRTSVGGGSNHLNTGRFGIFNRLSAEWEFVEDSLPSYELSVSPSGRFVHFQPYYFFGFVSEGSGSHETTRITGQTLDRTTQSFLDVPFENYTIQFSADESQQVFLQRLSGNSFQAASLKINNLKYLTFPNATPVGKMLPDGQHFAYVVEDRQAHDWFIQIVHMRSGGIVVGECLHSPEKITEFAFSPDGASIVYATDKTYIRQVDFDCELLDIGIVDVNENSISAAAGFRLAPNPVNSLLLVSHPEVSSGSIKIIDLTGREILSLPINNKQNSQIDVSRLSPGVYGVEIINGVDRSQQVFVKQ